MPQATPIHLPLDRGSRPDCRDRDDRTGYHCNRAAGHEGRHMFWHRRSCGAVRGVWA